MRYQIMSTYKIIKTVVVLLVVIISAFNVGVITTSLPDMEVWTSSTTEQMSTLFIWFGVGTILGSLLIGPQFDRINGMLLMAVCLLLEAIFVGLSPLWPILPVFHTLAALTAALHATNVTGGLSINARMWRTSVWMQPVIQMTDLMRTIGFAFSPQIAKPFLMEHDVHQSILTNTTTTSPATDDRGLNRVQYAYFITSALDIIVAAACASMCVWSAVRSKQGLSACFRNIDEFDDIDLIPDDISGLQYTATEDDALEPCSIKGCILQTLITLLLFVYSGLTLLFWLMYTYLYEYLGWSVDGSTMLVTMCNVTRFVFGVIMAVAARWVYPTWLSIIDVASFVVSSVLILLGSLGYGGDACTVIGLILSSVTMSNMYPTTITLMDETIRVAAPVMALLISSMGAAFMILGPVSGVLLYNIGATGLPWMLLALSLAAPVLFASYSVLSRVKSSPA